MYKTISKTLLQMALVLCLTALISPGLSLAKGSLSHSQSVLRTAPLPPTRPADLQSPALEPPLKEAERQQKPALAVIPAPTNAIESSKSNQHSAVVVHTWQSALSGSAAALILLAVLLTLHWHYRKRRKKTAALITAWRMQLLSKQTRFAILSEDYLRYMQAQKTRIIAFTAEGQSDIACQQLGKQMADMTRRTYAMLKLLQDAEQSFACARWPGTRAFVLTDNILLRDSLTLDDSLIPDNAAIWHGALPPCTVHPVALSDDYDARMTAVSAAFSALQSRLDKTMVARGELTTLLQDLDSLISKMTATEITPVADNAYLKLKETVTARIEELDRDPLKSADCPPAQSKISIAGINAQIQQACSLCDQIEANANQLSAVQEMLIKRRSQSVQFAYPGANFDQDNGNQLYLLRAEKGYDPDQTVAQVVLLLQQCREELVQGQLDQVTSKINRATKLTSKIVDLTEQVIEAKQLVEANVQAVEIKEQALQKALPEAQNSLKMLEAEFLPASIAGQRANVERAQALALSTRQKMESVKQTYFEQLFCLSLAQLLSLDSEIVDSLKELRAVTTRLEDLQDSRRNARILLGEVDKFAEEVGKKLDQNAATNSIQTVRKMVEALRALARQKQDVTQDATDWFAAEASALTLAQELKTIDSLTEDQKSAHQ